jgi:hypothetical protein
MSVAAPSRTSHVIQHLPAEVWKLLDAGETECVRPRLDAAVFDNETPHPGHKGPRMQQEKVCNEKLA